MKLTDTQLLLLSAASRRDDRALEPPPNLTGGATVKVVAKLLTEGLVEEIRARGSLPVWRRDDDGPRTLRITKKGQRKPGKSSSTPEKWPTTTKPNQFGHEQTPSRPT